MRDCQFSGDGSSTRIVVLDLGDRTAPKTVREIGLSGSLIAARRIGNAVHTVTSDNDKPGPDYPVNPSTKIALFPVMRDQRVDEPLCEGVLRTALRDGQAFTSVVSFDLTQDRVAPTTVTIQSRSGSMFASRDALYFSVVLAPHDALHGQRRDMGSSSTAKNTAQPKILGELKIPGFSTYIHRIAGDRVKVQRMGHLGTDIADLSLTP